MPLRSWTKWKLWLEEEKVGLDHERLKNNLNFLKIPVYSFIWEHLKMNSSWWNICIQISYFHWGRTWVMKNRKIRHFKSHCKEWQKVSLIQECLYLYLGDRIGWGRKLWSWTWNQRRSYPLLIRSPWQHYHKFLGLDDSSTKQG